VASRGQFSADILANSSGLRFTVALGKSYQDTDPAYLIRLLRARRERPRSRRAAGQRDELAAFHPPDHSITWSARASSVDGISRPSAFATMHAAQ
jgi:hypothetical protein